MSLSVALYRSLVRPWLFRRDAEAAHDWTVRRLARWRAGRGLVRGMLGLADARLEVETLGRRFPNPIGLAAGLDKNGEALDAWPALGFGFVEIGTITPRPQPGNPRPRLFRLPEDRALINRLGFNSHGAEVVRARLIARRERGQRLAIPLGINIGKNKETPNEVAVDDYRRALDLLDGLGDYVTVNISSPNTPGLRLLQSPAAVTELVRAVAGSQPVLVKVAPDFERDDLERTVDAALEGGAAGIIATNTTITRPGLRPARYAHEAGGLSGAPLHDLALAALVRIVRHAGPTVPIIGVGGISSSHEALERLQAGAQLLQVYTTLIYDGPGAVAGMLRELLAHSAAWNRRFPH